jgi:hypothetical protein
MIKRSGRLARPVLRGCGGLDHAGSRLYLPRYRACEPTLGRWISREPIGGAASPFTQTSSRLLADAAGGTVLAKGQTRTRHAKLSLQIETKYSLSERNLRNTP